MRAALTLNGLWKFLPALDYLVGDQRWTDSNFDLEEQSHSPPEGGADMGWIAPGFDDAGWLDCPVPSNWNTAFEDLWSYEGHGWYRRTVRIPSAWEGCRVVFHSEGANYATKLYVNGTFAGAHEGGYTPFDIPVHALLRPGEQNTFAVSVENLARPDRCPGGQYGWWNYGGMYRDVELRVSDLVYFDDVTVITEVKDERTCDVSIEVVTGRENGAQGMRTVTVELRDPAGRAVPISEPSAELADDHARLTFTVEDAALWSPESPSLYDLTLTLTDPETSGVSDTWRHRIGLRTFRVKGTKYLLNGRELFVKGLNRHEIYPGRGNTHTESELSRDIDLLKWMHGNAFRCHYPNHRRYYELCDERGVLAYTELPLWQWGRVLVESAAPEALVTAKAQLTEMINALKNHTCVMLWSVSNENYTKYMSDVQGTREHARQTIDGNIELVHLAKSLDPTRPVVEASNCWPGDEVHQHTDITAVNVYVGSPSPLAKDAPGIGNRMNEKLGRLREELPDRPILMTEFGNWAVRGLKTDYVPGEGFQAAKIRSMWEQGLEEENVCGGFIWVFSDAEGHKRFMWVYEFNIAYGLFDHERRPKDAALALREMWGK